MEKTLKFRMCEKLIMANGAIKELPRVVKELGAERVLIITDYGISKTGFYFNIKEAMARAGLEFDCYEEVEPDPGFENVGKCTEAVSRGYDLLIGIGGGSSLDTTKVASVLHTNKCRLEEIIGIGNIKKAGINTVLIPTTSGTGSEVTPIAVLSDKKSSLKKGVVSDKLYAKVALVDPELTMSLPPGITAYTGMDALAHAVESYTNIHAQPFVDTFALEAIRLIGANLALAVKNGANLTSRYNMSLASLYGGMCLGPVNTAAAHALAYPLGGTFNIPHGIATSLLLPHVMAFNLSSNPEKFARIAVAFDEANRDLPVQQAAENAVAFVAKLCKETGNITRLRDLNISEEAIPEMAKAAMQVTRLLNNNPRPVTERDAAQIYHDAY